MDTIPIAGNCKDSLYDPCMDTHQSQAIYLGVDGGGSTCRARLRDTAGNLIGSGVSGPANLRLGLQHVTEQILACTHQALDRAGLSGYPLRQIHAGLGLAGAVLEEDLRDTARIRSLFSTCRIKSDAYTACIGAHLGHPGAIVIAGTGSCAQIISAKISRTYGGWGFDVSDQAGGAWLGQLAVRETVQSMDGLHPGSIMSDTISALFDRDTSEVLRWSLTAKPSDYAKYAPVVFSAAQRGDRQALKLVQAGCEQLTLLIRAVDQHAAGNISLLGGLADLYRQHLPDNIRDLLSPPRADALDGALIIAGLPLSALERT